MKPVFEIEKELLERKLGILLPENTWREGNNLYLNSSKETKMLTFKVENRNKLIVIKNNIIDIENKYKNKTYQDEITENNERLNKLEKESIEKTKEFIINHGDYKIRPSISGGKDSDVMWHILYNKVFKELGIEDYTIDFMNSTNETAQTYLHVKNDFPKDKLRINNPAKGMYEWLKEDKNYYIPTVVSRICCSTYKEGEIKKVLDKNQKYIIFLGARKDESNNRSEYDWDLNKRMDELYKATGKNKYKPYLPLNWKRFLPIVNWTDTDIWLYILREEIKYNKQYDMGFNRCGCVICCYMSDYTELLVKEFYPILSKRWDDLLDKHYEVKNVERRLKYTKEEFINNGKWKTGSGKEQELILNKPTEERVLELASLKGCSKEVAKKYFKRKCSCGKKLNSEEVGMFLKYFGRYEKSESIETFQAQLSLFDEDRNNSVDNRDYLCKGCFCKTIGINTSQYEDKVRYFRDTGCNLF